MSKNDRIRMSWFPRQIVSKIPQISADRLLILALAAVPTLVSAQADAGSPPETAASAPAPAPTAPPPTAKLAPPTAPTTLLPPPNWQELGLSQKLALEPLERDWDKLDATQKSKWLEMAPRFFTLPPQEQARLHERMRAWSRLSPAERQQARVGFQVAQQIKTEDRQAKWEAYQALPPERRQELADKAAQKRVAKPPHAPNADPAASAQAKSNLVPTAPKTLAMSPVAPSVLQAKPGATTVLITQAKTPPSHQQAGQTKVFADPDLVDSKTLLPKLHAAAAASR
jgi:hypothetical protein